MASSPRAVDEVLDSLLITNKGIDPTLDWSKGPLAILMYGISGEISATETMASYLTTIYQLQRALDIDIEDLEGLGNNYGLDLNAGNQSTTYCTFFRTSRPEPNTVYSVITGDLVSSNDGRYIYTVMEDVFMSGDAPDIYYAPTERRYEVNAKVQAVSVGDDFNLPSGNINTIMTGAQSFDGVTNKNDAMGGSDPIDPIQFVYILWSKLQGLNMDMTGNLYSAIFEADPVGVTDVSLVSSTDFSYFERSKETRGRVAYDMYVLTDTLSEQLQSYTSLGSEPYIELSNRPVQSVQYVMVDGENVPFTFVPDTARAYRNSPLATERIYLSGIVLQPGQVVDIRYFYYETIYTAWRSIAARSKPFGNDVLVRRGYPVSVYIVAKLVTTSATDRDQVEASVLSLTDDYLRDPASPSSYRRKFLSILDPREYQGTVLANISGISSFSVRNFARLDNAVQDVSVIEFNGRNEYAVLAPLSQIV